MVWRICANNAFKTWLFIYCEKYKLELTFNRWTYLHRPSLYEVAKTARMLLLSGCVILSFKCQNKPWKHCKCLLWNAGRDAQDFVFLGTQNRLEFSLVYEFSFLKQANKQKKPTPNLPIFLRAPVWHLKKKSLSQCE